MMPTLKQQYAERQATQLLERVRRADAQVISENNITKLMLEKMDPREFKQASEIIAKLEKLKGKGLENLDTAIDQAIADMNKFTGGGVLSAVWNKLKDKIGAGKTIAKIATFASALETGFGQIPTIAKNFFTSVKSEDRDKKIDDLLSQDPEKLKSFKANIIKALVPSGFWGAFKKMPYGDPNLIAVDITSLTPNQLSDFISLTKQIEPPELPKDEIKDLVQGKVETAPRPPQITTPGDEKSAIAQNTTKKITVAQLADQIISDPEVEKLGLKPNSITAVINWLKRNNKLKEALDLGILKTLIIEVYKNKSPKHNHRSKRS